MQKFLALYRSTASNEEQLKKTTPEQRKSMMDAWAAWGKKTGTALVEMGAPLGESAVIEGAAVPGHIGGYSFVQAESLDAAKKLFIGHPHFNAPGGSVQILSVMSMPGM